jgi:TolB-like protein
VTNQEIETPPVDPEDAAKRKKRKKDKVRSAWISFAGRIVAQIVGAAATVALGVTVLHQYKGAAPDKGAPPATRQTPAPLSRPAGQTSIAVLPMENFSVDAGDDSFADGMTETLIASLTNVAGLRVISRTSSMYFKGQRQALHDIAGRLGVRWIVEGSIARAGERVRITAQLIDARSDEHEWAGTYDRPVADLLGLQDEVASAIASAVRAVVLAGSAAVAHEVGESPTLESRGIEVVRREPAFER